MLTQAQIQAKIEQLEGQKQTVIRESRTAAAQLEAEIRERQELLNRTVNDANYQIISIDGQISAWREMMGGADAGTT